MFRTIIALVIGAHGVGHLIGVVGGLRPGGMTWGGSNDSWLLSPMLGRFAGVAEAAIFAIPTIGWLTAAALLFGANEAWRPVAIGSAVVSLIAIGLFPNQLQVGSAVGAVAVNLAALVGLLLLDWPSRAAIGA
ncbi:MAG TPA: hypothetical protein VLA59_01730 [Patescibacteria group bacterium]|nr:hypothetical protein [Patescibacteria group bacterium]